MCPETRSSDEAQLKSMEKTRENAVEMEKKAHAPHEACQAYAQDRFLSGVCDGTVSTGYRCGGILCGGIG